MTEDQGVEKALQLASERGWTVVSMRVIDVVFGIPLAALAVQLVLYGLGTLDHYDGWWPFTAKRGIR